jgi:hypothetical protein
MHEGRGIVFNVHTLLICLLVDEFRSGFCNMSTRCYLHGRLMTIDKQ